VSLGGCRCRLGNVQSVIRPASVCSGIVKTDKKQLAIGAVDLPIEAREWLSSYGRQLATFPVPSQPVTVLVFPGLKNTLGSGKGLGTVDEMRHWCDFEKEELLGEFDCCFYQQWKFRKTNMNKNIFILFSIPWQTGFTRGVYYSSVGGLLQSRFGLKKS